MGKRTNIQRVNAGSMADIAFLLLIFFLVTTSIETDVGIDRMLPKLEKNPVIADVFERNILRVLIDDHGQLLVDDVLIELTDLRQKAIAFLDNGGFAYNHPAYCGYCKGERNPNSSDAPSKAIISLSNNRETKYGAYISVQNELLRAYGYLRNREAQRLYQKDYATLESEYKDPTITIEEAEHLKSKIKNIKELFPLKFTESETK
ncbi:MAG: biopolymer transporter ExbD [Maribacter sp.]|nr:biopolymer transporter ExbD [Maribacter sp.]